MADDVAHPHHYNRGKIEVVEFIEDQSLDFHLGNAVKYICRAGHKDITKTVQDLEKGIWYISRRIELEKAKAEARTPCRPNDLTKAQTPQATTERISATYASVSDPHGGLKDTATTARKKPKGWICIQCDEEFDDGMGMRTWLSSPVGQDLIGPFCHVNCKINFEIKHNRCMHCAIMIKELSSWKHVRFPKARFCSKECGEKHDAQNSASTR